MKGEGTPCGRGLSLWAQGSGGRKKLVGADDASRIATRCRRAAAGDGRPFPLRVTDPWVQSDKPRPPLADALGLALWRGLRMAASWAAPPNIVADA